MNLAEKMEETMRLMVVRQFLAGLFAIALISTAFAEDTLQKIKERGTLIVGVKSDSKPWGFLDPSGKPIGLEIDLTNDVAKQLGVKLETVIVQSSNRIEFLQQGKVDMLIATMYDTPQRRRAIDMIQPHYYSAATNILAPTKYHFTKWEELKGKNVCGQQGSVYNKWLTQKYGADVMALPTIEEGYNALRAGNCVAFVYNDILLKQALNDKANWADYEVPLQSEDRQYHSIGVRLGEGDSPFGKRISQIVTDWHKNGTLIAFDKKWGLPPSQVLQEMHEKYK
jgi:polar amino acid transport system substrate-binding protein